MVYMTHHFSGSSSDTETPCMARSASSHLFHVCGMVWSAELDGARSVNVGVSLKAPTPSPARQGPFLRENHHYA